MPKMVIRMHRRLIPTDRAGMVIKPVGFSDDILLGTLIKLSGPQSLRQSEGNWPLRPTD